VYYSHILYSLFFFFSHYRDPRLLHSFPTRRSSDLDRRAAGRIDQATRSPVRAERAPPPSGPAQRKILRGLSAQLTGAVLPDGSRSEEHTSELQSRGHLVCRLLLEKKKKKKNDNKKK